ncbi:MAG: hypothetical protein JST23_01865 [Bacteroidetes bacterium]|nr:hypothetical protein [Bacteroidota bacterium]
MNSLIKTALTHIENEQVPQAKQKMIELYQAIKQNPLDLNKIEKPDDFASVISTMLQLKVINDDDEIERIAAIGYVVISKAIITDPAPNKNMFRLLILHFAREQFNYTLRTALGFNSGVNFFSAEGQMVGNKTANAIYEMEVYDLFTNPILYQKIPMFADAKRELDNLIRNNHFYNKSETQVIQQGKEFHSKALNYLTNKILVSGDVE